MKKLIYSLFLVTLMAIGFGCENKPEPPKPATPTDPVLQVDAATGALILQGDINYNLTLDASKKYLLRGFVYVINGFTITIPAGTVIFGDKDTKGALIIEKGARIEAQGTAERPIVFTSARPRGQRNYGDWGGLVLIGRAPHNQQAARQYEGGIRGQYDTFNVPDDNSGTLRYVRIEFAGVALTPNSNSEINGLTLYGVGAGTTIEYVQVSFCGDDSYEWFGGTVNCRYLVAHRGWDDDFDADHGYIGRVQFGVSLRDPAVADQSTSNGFEVDNFDPGTPASSLNNGLPLTQPTFANISVFAFPGTPTGATQSGSGGYGRSMHLRRNSAVSIYNTILVGYVEGLRLDGSTTLDNALQGRMDLRGVVLANMVNPVQSATQGTVTPQQARDFFDGVAPSRTAMNEVIGSDYSSLLLNSSNFNLTAPNFMPQAGSPLLDASRAATLPANPFWQAAPFRGAFGTTNWLASWTNFDPQNTNY